LNFTHLSGNEDEIKLEINKKWKSSIEFDIHNSKAFNSGRITQGILNKWYLVKYCNS